MKVGDPSLVFEFIGVVFTAVLYGLYCLIFGLYLQIQLKRTGRWKGGVFLYALTASFVLCTAYFIIIIIQYQFHITMAVLNEDSLGSAWNWLSIANDALYTAIDFTSQVILLYRCWIIWRQPLVMAIPCLLSLGFLVAALTTLCFNIRFIANSWIETPPNWYFSMVTAFFFLSLGVNAIVTALIVYKIITVSNILRFHISTVQGSAANGSGQLNLSPLISILIESGLITFVGQLAQSIMYKYDSSAFPMVGGCVVILYGISMSVVLVCVEKGSPYNILRTENPANSGRPIQLLVTTSTSKMNRNSVTDIAGDDPLVHDARSERKLMSN